MEKLNKDLQKLMDAIGTNTNIGDEKRAILLSIIDNFKNDIIQIENPFLVHIRKIAFVTLLSDAIAAPERGTYEPGGFIVNHDESVMNNKLRKEFRFK